MGTITIKVPDVGEGIAEAELVEWHVGVGDFIHQDDVFAAVMTDKATVEIPSSVDGKINWLGAEVGDTIAIGSDLIRIDVEGEENPEVGEQVDKRVEPSETVSSPVSARSSLPEKGKPLGSPAVRLRAKKANIDLRQIEGTGPDSIITHSDLDTYLTAKPAHISSEIQFENDLVTETKITGLRRKISERMTLSKSKIPHITIVEEVDVTELENLRETLNNGRNDNDMKLTILPFLMGAMAKTIEEFPQFNAHFYDEKNLVRQFQEVHIGIAAQTPDGLMVPVVKNCEGRTLRTLAKDIVEVTHTAKSGTATREQLTGSTITISSLGPLGAIATTPIINHPEVAIVGVNKIATRAVWEETKFVPRKMMNLSSSFDHRVIDGWDAAVFVQRLKALLETPLMIFV